jgi:capsule biosynthesis phosphatase
MIQREKCIVMDIDGTLCSIKQPHEAYEDLIPKSDVLEMLRAYQEKGFHIILSTSRNMNTYDGNVGAITAKTAKVLMAWLDRHEVPYDELHVGKPWAGRGGFYVDDKAIRPDEFTRLTYDEILAIVGHPDKA